MLSALLIQSLIPSLRKTLKILYKIVCTHVLPRFLAATTTFINPSRARSQQRDIIIIIIPPVVQPTSDPPNDLPVNDTFANGPMGPYDTNTSAPSAPDPQPTSAARFSGVTDFVFVQAGDP